VLAIAATLVIVLSGAFLVERSRQVQPAVADGQSASATGSGSSSALVASAQPPAVAPLSIGPAPAQPPAAPVLVQAPLVVLEPETRAATRALPTLRLPAQASEAAFALKIEAADLVAYSAALKDPATGLVTWRSQWMAASGSGDKARLLVTVPAGLLKPQHYTFDVSGRSTAGATEVVGSYAFEVTRR
jgi:hypothetical protein